MRLNSRYKALCPVSLPDRDRQLYMHTFSLDRPVMRPGYEDYLEPVLALCRAAGAIGVAHMTVDEKWIPAGGTQRRPKPHVDGRFLPDQMRWGNGGGGWRHYCNSIGGGPIQRMAVIVASSVAGCMAWEGEFEGEPRWDGDLSHLDLPEGEVLEPNRGYLLSPDCVHESLPMPSGVRRTFLRIALENPPSGSGA